MSFDLQNRDNRQRSIHNGIKYGVPEIWENKEFHDKTYSSAYQANHENFDGIGWKATLNMNNYGKTRKCTEYRDEYGAYK